MPLRLIPNGKYTIPLNTDNYFATIITMNVWRIILLLKWILFDKHVDIQKIQKQGLLSVKIAQMFAMRIDLLSPEKCKELSLLLGSSVQGLASEPLDTLLQRYTPPEWKSNFASIEPEPFASASVGQVHKGVLHDGTQVAIKLIKANYAVQFRNDVKAAQRLIRLLTLVYPKLRHVADPQGILNDIEANTIAELDLRNEISHQAILETMAKTASEHFSMDALRFARVYENLSNSNVLVRELVLGKTVEERMNEQSLPYSTMIEIFRLHGYNIFSQGTFHGDVHAGNIMLNDTNHIFFIDTGALASVPDKLRIGLFQFMYHLSKNEYSECIAALHSMAEFPLSNTAYQKYTAYFLELYKDFAGKTVGQVSLTRQMMFTIKGAIEHGMRFERGMFPIIKSMMYLDAMVLRCNPDAHILQDMITLTAELLEQFPELSTTKVEPNI